MLTKLGIRARVLKKLLVTREKYKQASLEAKCYKGK